MSDEVADVLICQRVNLDDYKGRPAVPARQGVCSRCGVPVWIAEGFCWEQVERGAKPVCFPCIQPELPGSKMLLSLRQRKEMAGMMVHRVENN